MTTMTPLPAPRVLRAIFSSAIAIGVASCSADSDGPGDAATPSPGTSSNQQLALEGLADLSKATDVIYTSGQGVVMDVSASDYFITLDHGPLPDIEMDAMRMPFDAHPSVNLSRYREGDQILFNLAASEEEGLLITKMCRPRTDGADCLGG